MVLGVLSQVRRAFSVLQFSVVRCTDTGRLFPGLVPAGYPAGMETGAMFWPQSIVVGEVRFLRSLAMGSPL